MEPSSVAVINQIAIVYLSNNFPVTSFVVRGRISVLGIPSLTDLTGIPDTRGHPNRCDSDHDH